jgi:urease accessory protein
VEAGDVHDIGTLIDWITCLLAHGGPRNDGIILAEAWKATAGGDIRRLNEANDLALAMAVSSERYLETSTQGVAFLTQIRAAWNTPQIEDLSTFDGTVAYPIAVGHAAAAHTFPLESTAQAFLAAASSALASAAIRLNIVGQTDGQRALARLRSHIEQTAAFAAASTLEDLGSAVFRSDIAAMRHETQETRLFRS